MQVREEKEEMKSITFSFDYEKIRGQTSAKLLHVFPLQIKKDDACIKDFLEYDTAIKGGGNYKLKAGAYVVLILLGNEGLLFTTIRSRIGMYGRNKESYYSAHIGETFKIRIKEKKEDGKRS